MSRLAYPQDARVWRGLLIGVPLGAALWLLGGALVWRLA